MSEGPTNPHERRQGPPEADDPRLAIPEVLRERPGDGRGPKLEPKKESFGDTAKAWGMALDLVFTTIGGFLLGWGFDYWRGTGPWGAIIGLAVGFMLAAVRLIRSTLKAEAKEQAERERKRRSQE